MHIQNHTPRWLACSLFCLLTCLLATQTTQAQEANWFEREAVWKGYAQYHFSVAGRPAYIVAPKHAAPGKPWVWRARFPGFHAEMDVELLGQGYHIAFVNVAEMFGNPRAMKIGDALYEFATQERGLAQKCVLEGVSRGGLLVYNWAARHPDRVACIYCDTPVCDFKSWPGGKGTGIGSKGDWEKCQRAFGLSEAEALAFTGNPIDHAPIIAKANIPVMHIVSENDTVVPPLENSYLLKNRLEELGHPMEVISVPEGTEKSHGHHFTHPDPARVVNFIVKHTAATRQQLLRDSKRILFLGDSITQHGEYVALFDMWLQTLDWNQAGPPTVINMGLSSETVSGLSEDGHAGGRFPRPDLAERLERVLAESKPDLVFACYGINCGIYQPFDQTRLAAYQNGIGHLQQLVQQAGGHLVVVTPPTFDDVRAKKPFSYNGVLDEYSKWLLSRRAEGLSVIDLHFPMSAELQARRKVDPEFTFQPDSVHPNSAGHWFMATQLMRWFGERSAGELETPEAWLQAHNISPAALAAVKERTNLRRAAYVSAAGHKRPGVRAGLPLEEAEKKAATLTEKINELMKAAPAANEQSRRIRKLKTMGVQVVSKTGSVVDVNANGTRIADAHLKWIADFHQITDLSLESTKISDAGIASLTNLQKLEWLNLYRCSVGNESLRVISKLPSLQHLPIGHSHVNDEGLKYLREMSQLVYLGLRGNKITDQGIKSINKLTQLNGLHLGETQITDAGLVDLLPLRKLQRLWLDKTRVTDQGLESLELMRSLAELHVKETQITKVGLRRLKRLLPQCEVHFE